MQEKRVAALHTQGAGRLAKRSMPDGYPCWHILTTDRSILRCGMLTTALAENTSWWSDDPAREIYVLHQTQRRNFGPDHLIDIFKDSTKILEFNHADSLHSIWKRSGQTDNGFWMGNWLPKGTADRGYLSMAPWTDLKSLGSTGGKTLFLGKM